MRAAVDLKKSNTETYVFTEWKGDKIKKSVTLLQHNLNKLR